MALTDAQKRTQEKWRKKNRGNTPLEYIPEYGQDVYPESEH